MEEVNKVVTEGDVAKAFAGVHDEIENLQNIVREGLAKWRSDLIKWLFISSITKIIMILMFILLMSK